MCTSIFFKIIRSFAVLSIILFLMDCGGGGGGGSSSTPASTTFKLFPDGAFSAGYQENYILTGDDTEGGQYTASESNQTGASTTFEGQQVVPIMSLIEITNTVTKAFITDSQTAYYTDDPNNRLFLGYVDETMSITTTATSTNAIPQTAEIGDFGTVGTYESTDGETEIVTWKLTTANNGLANLVESMTSQDKDGNLTSTEDHTYVIDQNGNRKSLAVRIYYPDDGITMTLSGNIM